jgi:hypothetical protein
MSGTAHDPVASSRINSAMLRIRALEQEVAKLRRESIRFVGTWNPARRYVEGDAVVDHGSLWRAESETHGIRPPAQFWRLIAKRGRDASPSRLAQAIALEISRMVRPGALIEPVIINTNDNTIATIGTGTRSRV